MLKLSLMLFVTFREKLSGISKRRAGLTLSLLFVLLAGPLTRSEAAVIAAKSPSRADVGAAYAAAVDGDTIQIPAGKADWTNTLTITKAITVMGAGIGNTIILDDVIGSSVNEAVFYLATSGNKLFRLTGIEIDRGTNRSAIYYNGVVQVSGVSPATRIDHCKFFQPLNRGIYIWTVVGVIDHCTFQMAGTQAITIWHDTWANQQYGDGSWSTPVAWGTSNSLYIEDNFFTNSTAHDACVDGYSGARFVFRSNVVQHTYVAPHGTESSQRGRGTRAYEIYNNQFYDNTTWDNAVLLRSGTGVIFSNTAVGFKSFCNAVNYRSVLAFPPWGAACGTSAWDLNNTNGLFATGTHTGTNNSTVLVVAGAGWSANQWSGYQLINTATQRSSEIYSNSSNMIVFLSAADFTTNMTFSPGQGFQIYKVEAALDQVGRSTCDAISGSNPSPVAWPHQQLEPLYVWSNLINGGTGTVQSYFGLIRQNREYYMGVSKPGYTPFTYPHPLTLLGSGKPNPPQNLRIIGNGP